MSFRGAKHPQGVRRIRKAAELPTAAQPVTEGFRPPESCPKNGIPQSASLTAPFNKGAKGRGLRIATSGFALLAMTGFFDTLTMGMDVPRSAGTAPGTGCFGRLCEKTAHPVNLSLVLPGKTQ